MADFIETSKSRNAKRTYDKIADADTFESVVSAFKADSTMGLTRKEDGAETAAGVGGSASTDSTEDTWSAKFSCSLGEDTVTVTITREYMLVNGFENDETLAAVEAWADTVEALSTPQ